MTIKNYSETMRFSSFRTRCDVVDDSTKEHIFTGYLCEMPEDVKNREVKASYCEDEIIIIV